MLIKCLSGARISLMISDDGTLYYRHAPRICAALVGDLHAARSRGTRCHPLLSSIPALELRADGLNEKGNFSGETINQIFRASTGGVGSEPRVPGISWTALTLEAMKLENRRGRGDLRTARAQVTSVGDLRRVHFVVEL
jgi:hypothetical protein